MRSEIITEPKRPWLSGRNLSPPPRYDIPYAETRCIPLDEGKIIRQHYSNYLYLMELYELRLDKPLTLSYQRNDKALIFVFMLQGQNTLMTRHGKPLTEASAGKCFATINTEQSYLTSFEAETQVLACISPRIEWMRTLEGQFPHFVEFIAQQERSRATVSNMEKSLIDKNIGRTLLDLWQIYPQQYEDFDHEMTYRVKQLFKSYHETLTPKYYLLTLPTDEKIRILADYLNTYFYNADITDINRLCERFFLTDRTLRRAFNREYGMTISAYVENIRLEYARSLLIETPKPVHQVAIHCGFNSSNYFCRLFSRKYGCSPNTYRKEY